MDLNKLMEAARQMQDEMSKAKEQQVDLRITGESGGGLVKVVLNGLHEVLELKIDPSLAKDDDLTMLEDLIRAAMNQANVKLAEELKKGMGDVASKMGLDLGAMGFPNDIT
ncbi:MAG: YbaB/EbfC family nucleoid-associated protein [Myxococcales bacterium]|nr:YbaB/EbfC family nucleoid-associated protein [Myxococcales bacterium]|tara:strand:- start:132 stop:464 length:333 start_codon:yes stop_codon:yes gene_type:complete